jgi:nucleosome-remodeling factor subunit BPTF
VGTKPVVKEVSRSAESHHHHQQQQQQQVKGAQKRKTSGDGTGSSGTIKSGTSSSSAVRGNEVVNKPRKRSNSFKSPGKVVGGPPPSVQKKKKMQPEKLYCICKTPYDLNKFYVGCDVCSNWFHGDCIGISEDSSKTMEEWTCDACKNQANQLYCLCKQPYDDSQ